ncbi:DNA-3-methyladenine glycosylase [Micromonospora sp. U21]|nr:DNA-3-methyladenine glycosylase [Micromonospora sp. U21]
MDLLPGDHDADADAGLATLADLLAGPLLPAARGLLGCLLHAGGVTVRITEVEAYAGTAGDPAPHAHPGAHPAQRAQPSCERGRPRAPMGAEGLKLTCASPS